MLILSRKRGEEILIGDSVVLTVTEIAHGQVRIGIQAPKEIAILRREVYERDQASKAERS